MPKTDTRLVSTIISALCAIVFLTIPFTELQAGNLSGLGLKWPISNVDWGDETDVEVEGKNINSTYSVTGIKAKLSMWRLNDNFLVYEQLEELDEVKPNTDFSINYGPLKWDKLQIGLSYRLSLEFTADFDEDPSDNTLDFEFEVGSNYISRDDAIGITNNYLINNHSALELDYFTAFIPQNVTPENTKIDLNFDVSNSITTDKAYWLSYVNFEKYSMYSHQSSVVLIDAVTGEFESLKTTWWPAIDGVAYPNADQEKNDLTYGEMPAFDAFDPETWIINISNEPAKNIRTCVIIVRGKGQNARDSSAFATSARAIKKELMKEKRGPQLSADQFVELNAPTGEELYNEIAKLKDSCDKLYFYYVGHGDKENGMVLRGDFLGYFDLFNTIFDQNIPDVNFLIDCCYSGAAVDEIQQIDGWKKHNITIITSSSKDTTSALRHIDVPLEGGGTLETGVGAYTSSFATCFGDLEADRNGDGKTSMTEAAEWIQSRNPLIENGAHINDYDPQIFNHRSTSTEKASNINFDDMDLRFRFSTVPDGMHYLRGTLFRGPDLFSEPNEENIYYASKNRLWDLDITNNPGPFECEIDFRVNDIWDDIPDGKGDIGLIYRMDANSSWMPHYPSEFNGENLVITAQRVTQLSQWAIAKVEPDKGASVDFEKNGIFIENYPNPFSEAITIKLKLSTASDVSIDILDISGRMIQHVASGPYDVGTYTYLIDGSELYGGLFFARIRINGKTEMLKLIHIN